MTLQTMWVYTNDFGTKKFTNMTREELIAALEETAKALLREQERHGADLELLAPRSASV